MVSEAEALINSRSWRGGSFGSEEILAKPDRAGKPLIPERFSENSIDWNQRS
jgi:hypothetical protein